MTRQQAETQAARDGGKGFLHLVGLHRESDERPRGDTLDDRRTFPEPEGDFGGYPFTDYASI